MSGYKVMLIIEDQEQGVTYPPMQMAQSIEIEENGGIRTVMYDLFQSHEAAEAFVEQLQTQPPFQDGCLHTYEVVEA